MPSIQTLTLADATPADHSFTLTSVNGNLTEFSEKTGIPVGDPTLIASFRKPVNGSEFYKVRLTLTIPEVLSVDGSTVVDRRNSAYVDFMIHERSTQADRDDLLALLKSALANATIDSMVTAPEPLY